MVDWEVYAVLVLERENISGIVTRTNLMTALVFRAAMGGGAVGGRR